MRVGVPHHEPSEDDAGEEEHAERNQSAAAILLAKADRVDGQAGGRFGKYQRNEECVPCIKTGKHQSRNESSLVHVANRFAELIGHHDQHQRRRNDLCQRAGSGDNTGGHPPVVAVAQHDRQRNQSHRNHRSRDDARGRREQRTDENHGVGQAATDGPEQLPDGVEQILRHARPLQHEAHERKERDREQRVVVHHAVDALGQCLQKVRVELAEPDAGKRVDKPHRAERERCRIAEQQHDHQRRKHDRRHICDKKSRHLVPLRSRPTISVFRSPRRGVQPQLREHAPAMRVDRE